jgi:hypothetical protein
MRKAGFARQPEINKPSRARLEPSRIATLYQICDSEAKLLLEKAGGNPDNLFRQHDVQSKFRNAKLCLAKTVIPDSVRIGAK